MLIDKQEKLARLSEIVQNGWDINSCESLQYLREMKYTLSEIAQITGVPKSNIHRWLHRIVDNSTANVTAKDIEESKTFPVPVAVPQKDNQEKKLNDYSMTPREMVKALYDMGYRIENNHLVCYTKQIVKLHDIIGN